MVFTRWYGIKIDKVIIVNNVNNYQKADMILFGEGHQYLGLCMYICFFFGGIRKEFAPIITYTTSRLAKN